MVVLEVAAASVVVIAATTTKYFSLLSIVQKVLFIAFGVAILFFVVASVVFVLIAGLKFTFQL